MNLKIEELKKNIEEFVLNYLPDTKDLEKKKHSAKVIHDGLWGTQRIEPHEIAFIDTPLFQRLREIHQTGYAYLTFPSATHTRFEHTLGVMLQIQRLGEALIKRNSKKLINEKDLRNLRISALFHDLGHGPFSHTSEEVFGYCPEIIDLKEEHPSGNPHEILSYLIVTSENFKKYCRAVEEKYSIKIPSDEIAKYIIKESSDSKKIYKRELINGPFDADKLDYLFRDSHFSGLPLSIDLDRLWYTVLIKKIKTKSPLKKEFMGLAVTQSGATSLEQILFSKMVLYTTFYHHHKIRTCDCMFAGIIDYMKENEIQIKIGNRFLKWDSPVDFLWVSDSDFIQIAYNVKNEKLHDLIRNLSYRNLLERALIISRNTIKLNENNSWENIQKHAKNSYQSYKERRKIAEEIWDYAGRPCLKQQIWLDLPVSPHLADASSIFVFPSDRTEVLPKPLSELFPTDQWVEQYGMSKWRGHIFCPREYKKKIGAAAKSIIEDRYNVEILPEAYQWCKVEPPN